MPNQKNQNIENTVEDYEFANQFQYNTVDSTTITILPIVANKKTPNQKLDTQFLQL